MMYHVMFISMYHYHLTSSTFIYTVMTGRNRNVKRLAYEVRIAIHIPCSLDLSDYVHHFSSVITASISPTTAITTSALLAALVAIIVTACVAIPLAVLSQELDETAAIIIEGVSKIVAAICILQLSLKIPKFLGVYGSEKDADGVTVGLTLKSIRFNVAWNIWREIAEIGIFLIPFMLGEGAKAIPLSGIAGIAVGALLGGLIYLANKKMKNKFWLAAFMAILLLLLSTGLFVGGWCVFDGC